MAALMKLRVIHVFTHDSHRPRRGRPDAPAGRARGQPAPDPEPATSGGPATRWRPPSRGRGASSGATARAACCCRARTCPPQRGSRSRCNRGGRGGYVLREPDGGPPRDRADRHRLGSRARDRRARPARRRRRPVRVVSMPSTTVFDRQDAAYRRMVLGRMRRGSPSRPADRRLAEVCRRPRRGDRHRQLRRIRAGRRPVPLLRPDAERIAKAAHALL